jgi:nucleoid DNA-binding protein
MYKTDIIREVARQTRRTQKEVSEVVNQTLDVLQDHLSRGKTIHLLGFGTFYSRLRKPSKVRHIRSRRQIDIPAFHVVAFRPGDILKRLVRKNLGKKAQKKRLSSTRLPVISKSL